MITPITKIAAEVVRQAAAHPRDTQEQTYQRVADQLHIDLALVVEAMHAYRVDSEQLTGDASDGCGEGPAGETGDDDGE